MLRMSLSLKTELSSAIAEEVRRAARRAVSDLEKYGEVNPALSRQIRAEGFTAHARSMAARTPDIVDNPGS